MKKDLKKGQWLFTCSMKPQQFGNYDELNPDDYGDGKEKTQEDLDYFKYNSFTSLNGSSHSQSNCGCKPISEEYAKWFLDNDIDSLYDPDEKIEYRFPNYERRVKELCKQENIKYEGI